MKKALILILTLSMLLSLFAIPSFADEVSEEEKAEIIDAAKTAYTIYDTLTGVYAFSEDEWFEYSGPGYKTEYYAGFCMLIGKDSDFRCYRKTRFKATSSEEIFEVIDKYYEGYSKDKIWVFVDTECQNYEISKSSVYEQIVDYYTDNWSKPVALIIDGTVYTYTDYGLGGGFPLPPDFDTAVVTYADEKSAEITLQYDLSHSDWDKNKNVTITMTKTPEGWKINGGTLFSDRHYYNWYPEKSPSTGENTALYIAIAGGAVVAMTSLVVRKKKKIA
jgi:LPXTG-motif cell wall-anchored protein